MITTLSVSTTYTNTTATRAADGVNNVPIEFNMPELWTLIEDATGDIQKYCVDGHHPLDSGHQSMRAYNKKVKNASNHVTKLHDDAVYTMNFM